MKEKLLHLTKTLFQNPRLIVAVCIVDPKELVEQLAARDAKAVAARVEIHVKAN